MEQEVRDYLDNMAAMIARQFEILGGHLTHLDERMGRLEVRQDAMHTEMIERFIAVDERFRTAELRQQQFETRVIDRLDALESRVAALEDGQRRLDQRLGGVEHGLLGVNERLDRLGDDTRQRFRQLGERVGRD